MSICEDHTIKNKINYIVNDNASNMKKAFTVCFPGNADSIDTDSDNPNGCDDADDDLDNSALWEELRCTSCTSGPKQELPKATPAMFYTHSSTNGIRWVKRD